MMMPTRPAPPPPNMNNSKNDDVIKRSVSAMKSNLKSDHKIQNGHHFPSTILRCRSTSDISIKKPPPRPPPPRISKTPTESIIQQRPQNIKIKLPGFRSRKKGSSAKSSVHVSSWHASGENKSHPLVGSLIDLKLPAHSPQNSTNYSSDSSVDSFDSDSGVGPSSSENPNRYSELSGSQFESGFEDDFDQLSTPAGSDPWSEIKPDPVVISKNHLTSNVRLNNEDTTVKDSSKNFSILRNSFKPTIIKPPTRTKSRTAVHTLTDDRSYESPPPSPPMPSVPAPSLPLEVIQSLSRVPAVPARPSYPLLFQTQNELPHCVALYSYDGQQNDDLSFKIDDKIILRKKINEEWFEGNLNGNIGMFPSCFVNVIVPLPVGNKSDTLMIALYDFSAQHKSDLSFKEGDFIRVLYEINADWLFGECADRSGQFPRCYAAEYLFDVKHSAL